MKIYVIETTISSRHAIGSPYSSKSNKYIINKNKCLIINKLYIYFR